MITKIRGKLIHVGEESLTLEIGPYEREILIPDFNRRRLQGQLNNEITLHTIEYLEGNNVGSRMTPRMIVFLSEVEREFFDLICSVDGVGVKKHSAR